jgi:hypothetical protein
MRDAFLDFEWPVQPAYHWQDWLDSKGNAVVVPEKGLASLRSDSAVQLAWQRYEKKQEKTGPVLGPDMNGAPPTMYRPMQREHTTLFRTFAALDYLDKNAILGFAGIYGLLGDATQQQGPLRAYDRHVAFGESHLTWAYEIALMRDALSLVRLRTPEEDAEVDTIYRQLGLDPEHNHAEDRRRLNWLFNVHLQHVQPRMAFESDASPRLSFAPLTLLSAMWLQLALAIEEDKQFQKCKFCRRLFEISTAATGFRRHREFCTDSCKTKDYRRRKREALRLAGKKTPVREIAKQTNTEPATIRKWLKARKVRRKAMKGST